jgi:hypothetical protein
MEQIIMNVGGTIYPAGYNGIADRQEDHALYRQMKNIGDGGELYPLSRQESGTLKSADGVSARRTVSARRGWSYRR